MYTEKLQFAERQFLSDFAAFPCEYCQKGKKITGYNDEKKGWPHSHPNIFSIPQAPENVNREMNKITKFYALQKENIVILYNTPYCNLLRM